MIIIRLESLIIFKVFKPKHLNNIANRNKTLMFIHNVSITHKLKRNMNISTTNIVYHLRSIFLQLYIKFSKILKLYRNGGGMSYPGLRLFTVIKKIWKLIVCSDYNALTLFRYLQKRSLICKERCTLQIHYSLLSTVRLSLT